MSESRYTLFRVDPRLVHATLMNAWVPARRLQHLLIVDAAVADDDRRRNIVEIAAMDVERISFADESKAAERLRENRDLRTGVLFSGLPAVEAAIDGGLAIDVLNVGHLPEEPDRQQYLPSVFLGDDELQCIARLQARGVRIELQALPTDEPIVMDPVVVDAAATKPEEDNRAEAELEIVNERGLHLRAAHVLAALCNRLTQQVQVGRDGYMVNAKSLLGLTTLGAAAGTRLMVVVEGPGASKALESIRELFASGFQEGVAPGMGGSG